MTLSFSVSRDQTGHIHISVVGLGSGEGGLGLHVVLLIGLLISTQEEICTLKMGSVRVNHMLLTCAPLGRGIKTM